jgi:hypothetical protein
VHQLLLDWYGYRVQSFAALPGWLVYSGYWALVLLTSYLIWAAVERPLRKAIVQHWPPWRRAAAAGRSAPRQALEVPGGRARSLFAALLDPAARTILATALLVATLAGLALYQDHAGRRARRLAAAALDASMASALPASRNVAFGTEFLLAGARCTPRPDGGLDITLTWQALRPTTLHYQLALHFLAGDRIVDQADRPQDPRQRAVALYETWSDTLHVSPATLRSADTLGIAIHTGHGQALPPDRGPRDWGGNRLRLPLPTARATAPSTTAP